MNSTGRLTLLICLCTFLIFLGCAQKPSTKLNTSYAIKDDQLNTSVSLGTNTTEVCATIKEPVCGSDGKTYANPCLAKVAGVSVVLNGTCKTCIDSDLDNIYTKGTITNEFGIFTDFCEDSKLNEYQCSNTNEPLQNSLRCPDGFVCLDGACAVIQTGCYDSDTNNPFQTGFTRLGNKIINDTCTDAYSVTEAVCGKNIIDLIKFRCPDNQVCSNGACTLAPNKCTDTDSGIHDDIQGNVTIEKNGFSFLYQDTCKNTDYVTEYFCSGGQARSEHHFCGGNSTCLDGACVYELHIKGAFILDVGSKSSPCEDSDGGYNLFTRGTVTKGKSNQYIDECRNTHGITEYFCVDSSIVQKITNCDADTVCGLGKCVPLDCSDTDQGIDLYSRGVVTRDEHEYDDYCMSGHSIFERYCNSGYKEAGKEIECPSHQCANGVCLPAEQE